MPRTSTDHLVATILHSYFNVPLELMPQAYDLHLKAMAAENSIGILLERFIASVLEPHGWIWCSGNTVRAVDFIEPELGLLLQIKNRDNSENSSSSKIRQSSEISKWFRLYSRRLGAANWDCFPLPYEQRHLLPYLNEANFTYFVEQQLQLLSQL